MAGGEQQDRRFVDVAARLAEWQRATAPAGRPAPRQEDDPWLAERDPAVAARLRRAFFAGYARGYQAGQEGERGQHAAELGRLERRLREAHEWIRELQDRTPGG